MKELININLPEFKASYKVNWNPIKKFENINNIKQVNGIVFNKEGKILIVNIVGNWQLPGGHIKNNESFEECLKREISEEADCEIEGVEALGYLKVSEIKENIQKPETIQLYYFARVNKMNEQTNDPAHNKVGERKFIIPTEFTNFVPWGETGKKIVQVAQDIFMKKEGNESKNSKKIVNLDFMKPLKEFYNSREEIDNYMGVVHPSQVSFDYLNFVSKTINGEDLSKEIEESIMTPNWDMLNRSKSYLRPFIFLLLIKGLGGKHEKYLKYASILELIHNGTLIHDDIEDNAFIRRGDKPIYLKYGLDIGVNCANILYFAPFLMFKKYPDDFSDLIKIKAYDCLIEHLNRVTWGQGLDILWHNNKKVPTLQEYLQMCSYKTGAIDRMVFSLAGVLIEADNQKMSLLKEFGEKFGICLQIHDDFSDIATIDRTEIGGKIKGNDISEGKKSIVNILALKNLGAGDRENLLGILSEQTSNKKKLIEAIRLIKKSGALKETLNEANKRFEELKILTPKLINGEASKIMGEFLEKMNIDLRKKYSAFCENEISN